MRVIEPNFEIMDKIKGEDILRKIELCGRVCYKSENSITSESARKFVKNIIKSGHESVLEHEKITVRIICDRGVTHEIVRHRIASYSQESTRYCNYSKDKFDGELTFIKPCFWDEDDENYRLWKEAMKQVEQTYMKLILCGASAQEARSVLPNSLKTEIVVTMNLREWRHFFRLRTSDKAHAIVLTQKQLLVKNKVSTHELSASAIDYKEYLFAKLTPKNKCIIIPGGGFLGTLWPNEEERVRRIINCFKDNKIIIFPQTVSYDLTSESGRKYLKQAQKIYSAHSNLTFFVREKQSYEIMQKYFPSVETVLVPDIVTLLDMDIAGQNRKDILFCMRSDLEKNVTDEQLAEIQQILKIHYPNEQMNKIDTVVPYMVSEGMRKKEVKNKLEQFKKAKLIITDRLHGMIFATITATPCIAFGNSNGKVKNVYGWLKHNEYIKYVNDIDEFKSIVETLDIERKYYYDKTILYDDFEPLLNIIKEIN